MDPCTSLLHFSTPEERVRQQPETGAPSSTVKKKYMSLCYSQEVNHFEIQTNLLQSSSFQSATPSPQTATKSFGEATLNQTNPEITSPLLFMASEKRGCSSVYHTFQPKHLLIYSFCLMFCCCCCCFSTADNFLNFIINKAGGLFLLSVSPLLP